MMDNEIVIIRENMMMGLEQFLKFCFRNHFYQQCYAIQKIFSWNECHPPYPIVVNNIIYLLCEILGCLKNK
jgi:hypothetical protein